MMNIDANQEFEKIVQQNKGIIYKVVRAYCQNEEDRKDLVQEIMIQIWHSLPKYDQKFAITTWIYRISINVTISFFRKQNTRQFARNKLNESHLLVQENQHDEKEEQLKSLEQFISELNELDKAFMLLYLENKSYAEIAEILGFSVTNVGTRISRIKDKLKNRFSHING